MAGGRERDGRGCGRGNGLTVFETFVEWVSGAWWTYPLVFAIAMLDAFFPLVPSESVVIAAGVVAAAGDLQLPAVIAVAVAGAFVGDNISYGLGSWLGEHTVKRVLRSERAHRGLDWAERQLIERGTSLIVVARFIPGGRTAVTFASGYIHTMSWRRFAAADALAASLWGTYAGLLGYLGGKQFEDEPWKGLVLAFALAIGLTVLVEWVRHIRKRR